MLPSDATAIYWEGRMLIHNGMNEKAMLLFNHNKKLFPKQKFDINLGLAHGYKALKDDQKTIKHLKLTIKYLPKDKENARSFHENWLAQLEKDIN